MKNLTVALSLLCLILGGSSIYFYKQWDDCRQVPSFTPALVQTSKYVGYERSFHYSVSCDGRDIPDDCTTKKPIDVTGQPVVLSAVLDGHLGSSSFVVDWVENTMFYVDLSDDKKWNINYDTKIITFNAPEIHFDQVIRPGNYLPYVKDRNVTFDDEKALLELVKQTSNISANRVSTYLKDNKTVIQGEMAKSIKGLVEDIVSKMGYPNSYQVNVVFDGS